MAGSGLSGYAGVRQAQGSPPALLLQELGCPGLVETLASQAVRHEEDQPPRRGWVARGGGVRQLQHRGLEVNVKDRDQEYEVEHRARQCPNPVIRHSRSFSENISHQYRTDGEIYW